MFGIAHVQFVGSLVEGLLTVLCAFRETLVKKQGDLRSLETQITNATRGVDFEASVETVQNNLQKNQE